MSLRTLPPPFSAGLLCCLAGCTLTPPGLDAERQALDKVGAAYEPKVEDRHLPDLPARPQWKDVLSRAFLANGDLESAYFEWKAALERVRAAGAWPNADLSAGFSYMFSSPRMKSFDRATFSAAPDSAANLTIPAKARRAAAVALDEARAAGERFRAQKFDLQKRVLFAWADYTVRGRAIRSAEQELVLMRMDESAAQGRLRAGGRSRTVAETGLSLRKAELELADLRAEQDAQRAALNTLMGREAHEPLEPPDHPGEPRRVPADDASLLRASAEMFPEVAGLARELEGSRDALELARLRWVPDINPVVSLTGTASRSIGAVVVLPTTIEQIRGGIRQAESQVRAAEARLRQKRVERIGEYVALIVELRRAEQRVAFLKDEVLPAGRTVQAAATRDYESGSGDLKDVLDARRAILQTELAIARSEADIERAIVDIECCLGVDIETIRGRVGPEGASHE